MEKFDDPEFRRTVTEMWDADGLTVRVGRTRAGGVRFEGVDLRGTVLGPIYEYAITVSGDDTWGLLIALGASDDELLNRIRAISAEVTREGELSWLRGLGIEPTLWSNA